MYKKEFKAAAVAKLGRRSRRTRSQGGRSKLDEADSPYTPFEQSSSVQIQAQRVSLREKSNKDAQEPFLNDDRPSNTPQKPPPKPGTKKTANEAISFNQGSRKTARHQNKVPRVHNPHVAQVPDICAQVSQSSDESRHVSAEASLEHGNKK